MSERMVTTIGDLGLRAHGRGVEHSTHPPRRTRRRPESLRFDDLDGMMEIGDVTIPNPDDPTIPPSNFPPGTFDVPGSGEIVIPEVVITPGPDFTPSPVTPSTPSSSSSAAAAPSKAAWARGDGSYILQPGNTLSGLAATYLSAAARWPEIWNVQTDSYRAAHTPDKIIAGEVIAMPAEAQAKARSMGLYGIGANVLGRGFSGKQVAAAAGGVVLLGTIVHFAMK